MIVASSKNLMNHEDVNSGTMDLHRRIALVLRKEPGLIRELAGQLRSKFARAKSVMAVGDHEWEWYVILSLWSPLQVIRLLEGSSEQSVRLRQNSPFVTLLSTPEQRDGGTERRQGRGRARLRPNRLLQATRVE
jgi:hypothetical protein